MNRVNAKDRLTVTEFLTLPESDEWMELVDGEIIVTPKPSSDHQAMVLYLGHLLHRRIGQRGRLLAEKEMLVHSTDGRPRVRCPDLTYISEDRLSIITPEVIDGPADLVIEILSPGTAEVDRIAKRDEYQASGVSEYWIVDMEDRVVVVYDFGGSRRNVCRAGDAFSSSLLKQYGMPSRFEVAEIFRVLP